MLADLINIRAFVNFRIHMNETKKEQNNSLEKYCILQRYRFPKFYFVIEYFEYLFTCPLTA